MVFHLEEVNEVLHDLLKVVVIFNQLSIIRKPSVVDLEGGTIQICYNIGLFVFFTLPTHSDMILLY